MIRKSAGVITELFESTLIQFRSRTYNPWNPWPKASNADWTQRKYEYGVQIVTRNETSFKPTTSSVILVCSVNIEDSKK